MRGTIHANALPIAISIIVFTTSREHLIPYAVVGHTRHRHVKSATSTTAGGITVLE